MFTPSSEMAALRRLLESLQRLDVGRRTLGDVEQRNAQLSSSFLQLGLDLVHVPGRRSSSPPRYGAFAPTLLSARSSPGRSRRCWQHGSHRTARERTRRTRRRARCRRTSRRIAPSRRLREQHRAKSRSARGDGVHDFLVRDALDLGQLLGRYASKCVKSKRRRRGRRSCLPASHGRPAPGEALHAGYASRCGCA